MSEQEQPSAPIKITDKREMSAIEEAQAVAGPPQPQQPKFVSEYKLALVFLCGNEVCKSPGSIDSAQAVTQALMSGGQFRFGIKCAHCGETTMYVFKQDVIVVPAAPQRQANPFGVGRRGR